MNAKTKAAGRFLGWQNTPIHQASFGRSTRGGAQNNKFVVKHSTGPIQEVSKDHWYVVDASEIPVGRLASVVSSILMGKHKATFTPGADSGDSVIVINSKKAFFTANKAETKIYYWHTQFMGGLKMESGREALVKHPDRVIMRAVQGMMPKNKLSRYQIARLKIYPGAEHPQKAQKPQQLDLKKAALLKGIRSKEKAA